ncbi:MAG: class I SAM-dependent methyltransferase [Patescibacteria group bacterium]|nr:class I SAM-dependent methyltransferase [Patescibacteria group bacterium]
MMPLAITFPKVQFTGIDSVRKKTIAVNEMLADLQVSNAKVVRTRIEDYPKESFDFITARAVAYIDKLL